MDRMLIAKLAILLNLELAGLILLVFRDGIVPPLAFLARQQDYLTHTSLPAHVKSVSKKLTLLRRQPH